jgi:ABC-type amino acid transport substrate-binding protein/heat shock protein HslJ
MSNRDYNIILGILVTIACIIAAVLLYVVYRGSQQSAVTPTPVPPTETPSLPDDAWERIQSTGIMRAGTSADYPPFAFRTSEFTLDGLDVAVINEVGRRLGVTVEISDIAFEGLSWALELEQIDVAIAALSITPERSERINFSEVYFVSEDATLAREGVDTPQLLQVEELAPFRIGVQRASVYSNWLNETLIDTGLAKPSQLVEYDDMSFAVRDLREGRIDLVILDLQPAQVAAGQGGVEIVAQGLNTQYFGIGIPKQEPTLLAQVNAALASMKADGTLATLIEEYTGVAPPPFPTVTPTSPAVTATSIPVGTSTPEACVDGMTFVEDINLNDNNMTTPPALKPGQPFRKGWRIQNTGTCTWTSQYRLTYDGGNSPASSMGGLPTPIQGQVPPGAIYDIYVDLVAPIQPGIYQGFWVLRNNADQKFGSRLWVGIEVPAPPTITPPPTQTPAPGISFTVNSTNIRAGECVTFRWSVSNVRAVYFYELGQPWQQHPVSSVGSSLECPPVTTTYELRVVKNNGSLEIRQITIYVQSVPGAPVIDRFTVDPPIQVELGQTVNLTWQVSGNVDKVTLLRGEVVLWDNAPLSSTMQDRPPQVGQVTYIIEANGPGGLSRSTQSITVTTPPPPTNTPIVPPTAPVVTLTPTLIPPTIISFALNPGQIQTDECTVLSWEVSGDVNRIRISRNGDVILDNAPYAGSQQDCLGAADSYVYRLEIRGNNGQTESSEQTLTVIDAPTVPPLEGTSWTLDSMTDAAGSMLPPIPDTTITALFGALGSLSGESGCNSYSTTYTSDGTSITIGSPSGTTMNCTSPAGVMDQEQRYLSLLPQASSYELSAGSLIISDANGRELLNFISRER